MPVFLLALLATAASAAAAVWQADLERSTFAVLTHRGGIAAGLAHDHLIVARGVTIEIDFDPDRSAATRLRFTVPVLALEVDAPAPRAEHVRRLQILGALSGDLPPVGDQDRAKVRTAMLAGDQLLAERYPEIRAELLALEPRGTGSGAGSAESARVALGWNARLAIEIRGVRLEKTFPVRWEVVDGELIAELLGELRFTEFGIRPYSAVLGAVKVDDLFHLWVSLVARPAP